MLKGLANTIRSCGVFVLMMLSALSYNVSAQVLGTATNYSGSRGLAVNPSLMTTSYVYADFGLNLGISAYNDFAYLHAKDYNNLLKGNGLSDYYMNDNRYDIGFVMNKNPKYVYENLDAEVFGDGEMPVVSGNGAEEFHLRLFAPGGVAHDAVGPDTGNRVEHDVKGGVPVDDDVLGIVFHHIAEQFAGFLDAGQLAVVTAIRAVLTGQIGGRIQNVHHVHGKIQLIDAGDTPAHVQLHVHGLNLFVFLFQLFQFMGQFFRCHLKIGLHDEHPSFGK